jgi:hypothetical protein
MLKFIAFLVILTLVIVSINTYSQESSQIWLICKDSEGTIYFWDKLEKFQWDMPEVNSGSMPLDCTAYKEDYEAQ